MNTMNQVLSIEIALNVDKSFNAENFETWEKRETIYNCSPSDTERESRKLYQIIRSLFL